MGLDLIVEARANPGHEAEYLRIVSRAFEGYEPTPDEIERLQAISTPAYASLGAPRVGHDPAADAWLIEIQGVSSPDDVARVLEEFHGHYALPLVECDGLPSNSHGGLYDGVDETSLRGSALELCRDVLTKALLTDAWEHKMPDQALAFGRALLAAADQAESRGSPDRESAKPGLLARLGLAKPPAAAQPFGVQLEIVREAGRWFVYWGERGHPIRAWS